MIYILRSNGPLLIQGNIEMIANHVNKNIFVLSFENTTNKGQDGIDFDFECLLRSLVIKLPTFHFYFECLLLLLVIKLPAPSHLFQE